MITNNKHVCLYKHDNQPIAACVRHNLSYKYTYVIITIPLSVLYLGCYANLDCLGSSQLFFPTYLSQFFLTEDTKEDMKNNKTINNTLPRKCSPPHEHGLATILDKIHVDTARALVTVVTSFTYKQEKAPPPLPQSLLVNVS